MSDQHSHDRHNNTAADIRPNRLDNYQDVFADLHPPLDKHEALVEADRCYFCYDAPCMTACPTHIDIPQFIRQIAGGNPQGAARTILSENILGGMCARVCPTETLCEEACVREAAEGKPVRIGLLQRHATDHLMESGVHPFTRAPVTGKSVAVVGAGPAGLACAHALAREGHTVTIFEARPKGGGLNEYGIASYKSVDNFAARELEFILKIGGITIETGKALGKDIQLDALRSGYDAVFLGLGLGGTNRLHIAGEAAENVLDAVRTIAELRQSSDLSRLNIGKNIVVIGGGMTAIDIAIQIKRLGAENVTLAYRRDREHMNASLYEQQLAQTEGVVIRACLQPEEILLNDQGQAVAIRFAQTEQREGKLVATGATLTLAADQIYKAIGQKLDGQGLGASGMEMSNGRIKIDTENRTSVKGIWAGGDCVAGGQDLTVASVQDGKIAAQSIHQHLMQLPEAVSGFAEAVLAANRKDLPSLHPHAPSVHNHTTSSSAKDH
ncbi:NAD(P)-dependent oxidoreductase [Pseudochrobactrum saccharolyticum]|uniref:NAD(P)-dependent oxidoreductase n=1 Tax=Pseudochrobactrum saccharolyticum TaxID=354352 RepID=UPI0027557C1F|nr:NAD(P)-dependent oxidoreductase [Pseudochrobactrum saccharolyticum]MDP8252024.1 NAD(P)-dependent oxidoreductase [Pseudochrobactrum saccharolyticum]